MQKLVLGALVLLTSGAIGAASAAPASALSNQNFSVTLTTTDVIAVNRQTGQAVFSAKNFEHDEFLLLRAQSGLSATETTPFWVGHKITVISLLGPYLGLRDDTDIEEGAGAIPGGGSRYWTIDLRHGETYHLDPNTPLAVLPDGGAIKSLATFYSQAQIAALLAADSFTHDRRRKVSLINGRGTIFVNRTKYFPTGLKRWTSGALVSRLFRELSLNFNGDNEDHTIAHFRRYHSTEPNGSNGVYLYGIQSEDEQAQIFAALHRSYAGYLADVTGSPAGPVMELRGGTTEPVETGSIFVNCTGSFFRESEMANRTPCLSARDTVVSISQRDGFHVLTSVAGFFVTHLLYRGALRAKGFFTLDHEALFRQDRNAWVGASAAQAYMNQVIAVQTLPMMLLDRCGLDFDRWYPLPRRMAGLIRLKRTRPATSRIAARPSTVWPTGSAFIARHCNRASATRSCVHNPSATTVRSRGRSSFRARTPDGPLGAQCRTARRKLATRFRCLSKVRYGQVPRRSDRRLSA